MSKTNLIDRKTILEYKNKFNASKDKISKNAKKIETIAETISIISLNSNNILDEIDSLSMEVDTLFTNSKSTDAETILETQQMLAIYHNGEITRVLDQISNHYAEIAKELDKVHDLIKQHLIPIRTLAKKTDLHIEITANAQMNKTLQLLHHFGIVTTETTTWTKEDFSRLMDTLERKYKPLKGIIFHDEENIEVPYILTQRIKEYLKANNIDRHNIEINTEPSSDGHDHITGEPESIKNLVQYLIKK